ncbi:DUF7344 domain-containing protein [Haloarcula salina]|uniref:DUF7344 domain-containing protein n=1 Tax=Haloarcula salina TaxID=1429914 RepID=A0AA41G4S1_9EURY|nr:hypothetical protein [Haloarcula salina]MBV0903498.1 hypothetical protein [Haloarcula salina]
MTADGPTQAALHGFEIFRHEVRIGTVEVLSPEQVPMECATLVAKLSEQPTVPTDSPDQLADSLHHRHLPALDETDVIDYEPSKQQITAFDPERLETLIDAVQDLTESLEPDGT